ncbi:alginate O-acetyltransferase AlgX-related protein [Portibacter lacus]|uniref:Sugar O-acetyltransferase n=1 Tax=Portibacter lacus TaxID=1099794 RepID=A0AA37SNU1_9BACT|nr:hypothetical protein [Portibacter lacus]GLR16732.1 sugar O-acetyltransferase [Portibacter lacus]
MKALQVILIILTLLVSIILQLIPNLEVAPLKGFIPVEAKPTLTKKALFDFTFQDQSEKFLKQNIRWTPSAVRFHNQLKYDIYGELRPGMIEGKDGYLFESGYIESYLGKDYIGKDSIWAQTKKLKAKIDTLEKKGTKVLVALAINKAMIHLDKLPEKIQNTPPDTTNYESYLEAFQYYDIPYIDLHEYIKNLAPEFDHPLTYKNGIHWSKFGGLLAADTLNKKMGALLGKKLNKVHFDSITITDIPAKEDVDIGESLNLIQPLAKEMYHYPEYSLRADSTLYKPKVLMIGDSFCWTLWGQWVPHEYWDMKSRFLYYNRELWELTETEDHGTWVNRAKRNALLDDAEVVLLLYSTFNLNNLGTGFIDD